MSLWRFNDFEAEIDITDADFYDKLDEAQRQLEYDFKRTPVTGKKSDMIRAQVKCFTNFFDAMFYPGAGDVITGGKCSLEECFKATDSLSEFIARDSGRVEKDYSKYTPQNTGNRQQRRQYNKQEARNYNRNKGGRGRY